MPNISKKISFVALGGVLTLGACATFIDKSVQEIEFVTPGAYNTVCDVYIDRLRYTVTPPDTLGVQKSKEDMIVDCMAPGNRRKKIYIKPKISDTAALNAFNGGAGVAYDYFSKALFYYPDRIEIDFTNSKTTPMSLPAQNQPDIRQPEDYPLEEFSPGAPRLNSDSSNAPARILRRGEAPEGYGDDAYTGNAFYDDGDYSSGKGNLKDMQDPSYRPIPGE